MANAALFQQLAVEAIPDANPFTTTEQDTTIPQYTKVDLAGINPRAFPKKATKLRQDHLFNRLNGYIKEFKNRNGFKEPLSFTMRRLLAVGNILVSC